MGGRIRGTGGRFERAGKDVAGDGRYGEEAGPTSEVEAKTEATPPPHRCRNYVRRRVAKALPAIVRVLIEQAMEGSVAHMALLIKTAGLDQKGEPMEPAKRREKGLEQILREQWERDRVQREADEAAAAERFRS